MAEQQESNTKANRVTKLVNNRNFLVFIAFVVLSSFLWFLNYLNKNLNSDITIKYKFKNIPRTINSEDLHGGELLVNATGQGYNLLQESIKTRNIPLNIDLESKAQDNRPLLKYTSDKSKAYIVTNDIRPLIRKKIGDKINIGEIKPDTLYFNIINVKEKVVPIDLTGIAYTLSEGSKITKTTINPDSVTIIGQKSSIDSIEKINVIPENIGLIKKQKQYNIELDIPEGITSSNNYVSLTYEAEMFTEGSKKIKIKAINFPHEYNYTILPEYVTITYATPLSHYDKVQEYDFSATVDYNQAAGNNMEIKVATNNSKAKIIKNYPQICTFVLEKK